MGIVINVEVQKENNVFLVKWKFKMLKIKYKNCKTEE